MNHSVLIFSFIVGITLMGLSVIGLAGVPILAVPRLIYLLMAIVGFLVLLYIFVRYE